MPSRNSEREAMQDAVEMAVMSSVQHPNVVSVYSCLTDMVEAEAEVNSSLSLNSSLNSGPLRSRYRRMRPDEDPEGELATYNCVVMEVRALGPGPQQKGAALPGPHTLGRGGACGQSAAPVGLGP
jgi:hypothetical protein